MKNLSTLLFLTLLLLASCHTDKPGINKTFYGTVNDNNKLYIDTTKVLRIENSEIFTDLTQYGSNLLYKINRLSINGQPQIHIVMDAQGEYNGYLRGNPQWKKIIYPQYVDYEISKLPDSYLWKLMYKDTYLIDSVDIATLDVELYTFNPVPYDANYLYEPEEEDETYDPPGETIEKIFSLEDIPSYPLLNHDEIYEKTGYQNEHIVDPQERQYILLPKVSGYEKYNLLLTLAESDSGPYCFLEMIESGNLIDGRIYCHINHTDYILEDGKDDPVCTVTMESTFEVYNDFSVKSVIKTDSCNVKQTVELETYYFAYGMFQKGGYGGTLRKMDLSDMPDNYPEVEVVTNYLNWYKTHYDELMEVTMVNYVADGEPYSVNMDGCNKFLDILKASGCVSDRYISGWKKYFEYYEQYYQENIIDDGPPEGFDFDLILLTHDYEEALEVIPDNMILKKIVKSGNNYSEVHIDVFTQVLKYTLRKYDGIWLID